ncbi:MAG: hypothetical protein JNM25_19440 [Planctomycetes bacterium]|nr:hypothetical protein [Planctomycetota bacterium]
MAATVPEQDAGSSGSGLASKGRPFAMVRRPHLLACLLSVEGSTLLLCGAGLVVTSMTGRVAATLGGGTDTGALAFVAGPVLECLCCAFGCVLCVLGVAGLVAGWAALRRHIPLATRIVLMTYAVSWGLLATLACLRAGAPQCDVATSLAAGVVAATFSVLHMIVARSANWDESVATVH